MDVEANPLTQVPVLETATSPLSHLRKLWNLCKSASVLDQSIDQTKDDKLCCHKIAS